jgi:redox-sensing transcriptional repressor
MSEKNSENERISEAVIRRLPKYFRYLSDLETLGVERISSSAMSKGMSLNASQIRRDLNCFGGFGQQGYGYSVKNLKNEIKKILAIDKKYNAVIIGSGNIGQALANYKNFVMEGYDIKAIFDIDSNRIGRTLNGIKVRNMSELEGFLEEAAIKVGILATPKEVAQEVAETLINGGVTGIWNFAPQDVKGGGKACVENVHLSDGLYVLSYYMNERNKLSEE